MVATTHRAPEKQRRPRKTDEGSVTVGRSLAGTISANTIGILFSIVMIFPVYWIFNTALKPSNEVMARTPSFWPDAPTLSNFASALNAPNFMGNFWNGVRITVAAVLAALVIGFLGALAIARFKFYGRKALIVIVLAVQLVPYVTLLIPIALMYDRVGTTTQDLFPNYEGFPSSGLKNTLTGVTLVYIVMILPYTVWTLRGFIAAIPRELDEAALVDGCSRFQTFWRIILPLTGPGLVATSIYGFIQAWNEFIIINTLNNPDNQNLMSWLLQNQTNRGTAWGPLMAGAIITALPVVTFFLIIQRNIASGLTAGAVKG